MSPVNDLANISKSLSKGERQLVSKRIKIYLSGVSIKLKQAEYSLEMIRELSTQTVYTTTTESTNYTVNDKLAFFVDSFFAFLYSTFDITSQVVNQKLRLKIDEKQVTFKEVNKKLTSKHSGKPTQRVYKTLSNSRKFKKLQKYRNCSTHRREICIKEGVQIESVTPCYSSSGPLMAVKRLICDDPYSLNPSFGENHELVKYTSDMLQWVNSRIFVILRSM